MAKMNTAKVLAYAKLNLTLDICGTQNGYHMLDSLVVTVGLYDKIIVKKRKDNLVGITMHGMGSEEIPFEGNHAVRAAEAFVEKFRTAGAEITVYKNIPMGAGLGGSSADAAGVLNALAKLYGVTDERAIGEIADALGSDTKYLLRGGFARLQGRGERIERLGECPEMHFLLLCPKNGVSTAECYKKYDALQKTYEPRADRCLSAWKSMGMEAGAKLFGNDLYEAAAAIEPDAEEALRTVKSFSPLGAAMTGSGSAAFALFPTRELAEWAKSRYRGKFRAYCADAAESVKKKKWCNPFVLDADEIQTD